MLTVETISSHDEWNRLLLALPTQHILQSWEWGAFKTSTGWEPNRLVFKRAHEIVGAISIGVRRVGPFSLIYASKGPLLDYEDVDLFMEIIQWLEGFAKKHRAIWLKIDPDVVEGYGVPHEADASENPSGQRIIQALQQRRWVYSNDQVQFKNTVIIDLQQSEDEILASMSQNTRRKVRLADRDGITIHEGGVEDIDLLYSLYQVTAQRDGFLIRPKSYYEQEWRDLFQANMATAFIAKFEGQPIAHVILYAFGQKCLYFTGASSNEHRDKMPNYRLQWEAIRWAKARGCQSYDMWGAPTEFVETDALWGVFQFKRGFRGTVVRYIGAWDYAPSSLLYRLYTEFAPRLMSWLRNRRT